MSDSSLDATEDPQPREVRDRIALRVAAARPPARIGRFAVLRPLGAGGMGQVLLAYDESLDRKVAIKLIHPGRSADPKSRARLGAEARALAQLSHPNVVAVYDVGDHEGQLFIAMEFVEGDTLAHWLRAASRSVEAIVDQFAAVARGLQAAHDANLVHRDFKPDNVLVDRDGRPKVADFGLAGVDAEAAASKRPDLGARDLTRTGALLGTPFYMSPQQFAGEPVDARTDQFSFCVALWHALYGVHPFGSGSAHALASAVCTGNVREPPGDTAVPTWLRRVLECGLQREPEKRFRSMADLAEALRADPSRRRTRRLMLAAAVLVGAGSLVGVRAFADLQADRAREACASAGAEIESIYDDEVRARLSTAAARPEPFDKALPWLDAYAAAWSSTRISACIATEVDQERASDLYALSLECLDERRAAFESQLRALASGDPQASVRAIDAAAALPSVDACLDDHWLATRPRPPADPVLARRVIAARHAVASVDVLLELGRHDEALALARETFAEAEAIAWPPLTAESRYRVAMALERAGSYRDAKDEGEQAYYLAGTAGEDELAARVATLLVGVTGRRLKRADEAIDRWAREGQMSLARSGRPDPRVEANLLAAMADAHTQAAAYTEARPLAVRALGIDEEILGIEHPRYADALLTLGTIDDALGDYEAARSTYERALALQRAALGSRHPGTTHALAKLATLELATGQHERARALLEEVLEIRERALGPEHPLVAQALHNLANVLVERGEYPEARRLFERSLRIRERALGPDHVDVASSLNMLAVIDHHVGALDSALARMRRVLGIQREALGHDHPDIADTLNNLAVFHYERGDLDEVQQLLEEALSIQVGAFGREHPEVAGAMSNLARALAEDGSLDRAESLFERAATVWERALGPDHPDLAFAHMGLAETWLRRGDPARALPHARRAHDIREQAGLAPHLRAESAFVLAQALVADPEARARALELAADAQRTFADQTMNAERDEVAGFIADHTKPRAHVPR